MDEKVVMKPSEILRWGKVKERYDLFNRVFSSVEGQKVLDIICEMGHVSKPTFAPLNPNKTILNEGMRVLALDIIRFARRNPTRLAQEAVENK